MNKNNIVYRLLQKLAIYILKKTEYKFTIKHNHVDIVLECFEHKKGENSDDVKYHIYAKNVQGGFLGHGRYKTQGESWKDSQLRLIDFIKKSAKVVI